MPIREPESRSVMSRREILGGGKARGAVSQGTALLGELRQVGPARRTAASGGARRGAVGFHSGRNARKTARRDPLPLPSLAEVGFPPAIRKERTKVYHLAPLRRGTGGAGSRRAASCRGRPPSGGRDTLLRGTLGSQFTFPPRRIRRPERGLGSGWALDAVAARPDGAAPPEACDPGLPGSSSYRGLRT